MGIILGDCEINDAGSFRGYDDEQLRQKKELQVNDEKNIWRRVLAFKDSLLSIGERKSCTHCDGPHAHWRCPKRPAYSETKAMIELGKLDYERTFGKKN